MCQLDKVFQITVLPKLVLFQESARISKSIFFHKQTNNPLQLYRQTITITHFKHRQTI